LNEEKSLNSSIIKYTSLNVAKHISKAIQSPEKETWLFWQGGIVLWALIFVVFSA
jgi:hypothetical protein